MTSAVKWVPRSELTLKGSPNLEKMWFINRHAVVSAVSLEAGRHSIHFVNSQTMVRKYLKSSFPKRYKSILIVFMKMTFFYLDPYILLFNLSC